VLALAGKIVSFDSHRPPVEDGVVYIADDGKIAAVSTAGQSAPPEFASTSVVKTGGVLYPGLIDLHSHILYNLRTLWAPPRTEPYASHNQWPGEGTYPQEITGPAKIWSKSPAAKEVLAYAEVKAIVGGTTAIQGAPGTSKPYEGFLVRNVDNETFGSGDDKVSQSALTLELDALRQRAKKMREGSTFVYHLAEGTTPKLLDEFKDVTTAQCLQERLVAIHVTALAAHEFEEWSPHAGSIVWSPFSNLWLYRDTTKVVEARDAKLRVCLGSDWGPSGSKNVLGELKVADLWNRDHLGGAFSDQQLCGMVTTNPADALEWTDRAGRLKPGLEADILVVEDRADDPFRNLIEATERDVRLVLIGGNARYGRTDLMRKAKAQAVEPIPQAGRGRSISLAGGQEPMTWQSVLASLEAVRKDPAGAIGHTDRARARGEEPFELFPDMPEGPLTRAVDLSTVTIPPLDTLRHDAAFFRALERSKAPILDGLLDRLPDYYGAK
jgi:cytosine/adenosine deaminase-related metal-dependent hydrolase